MQVVLALLVSLAMPFQVGSATPDDEARAKHLEALVAAANKAMEDTKDDELAAALYAEIAVHPAATPELEREVARRSEILERRLHRPWYAGLVETGTSVGLTLGLVLVLLGVLLVARRIQRARLGKKSTSSFKIVDRRTESNDHAQILAARFFTTLRGALEVDGRPDLIGRRGRAGDLVLPMHQSASAEIRTLSDNIDEGQIVEVGGLRLNLRTIVRGVVDAVLPTRFAYAGELTEVGKSIHLYLSRFDRFQRRTELWTAKAAGDEAEEDALTQLAYKLACADVKDRGADALPSRSPDALYAYHRAVRAIDVVDERHEGSDQLKEVRRWLEEALAQDPRLHAARFRLAIVLRKMGDTGRALAVLDEMRRVEHRWRPYADYHRARVLLEKSDAASLDEAFALLAGLTISSDAPAGFASYVRSARVAVLAKKLSIPGIRLPLGDGRVDAEVGEMNTAIRELDAMKVDSADLTVARGLARYARAKYLLSIGDLAAADEDARRAAVQLPRYSSVKAVLATIVRLGRKGTWEDEAEQLLDEAAEVDAADPMVLEERGVFLLAKGEREAAIELLAQACDERASARFAWGEALAADAATRDQGLKEMLSAVERHLDLVTSVELRRVAEAAEPSPEIQPRLERAQELVRDRIHFYRKAQAELGANPHLKLLAELALLEAVRDDLAKRIRKAEALRDSPAVPTPASDATRVTPG